jgi:hypothetical protein
LSSLGVSWLQQSRCAGCCTYGALHEDHGRLISQNLEDLRLNVVVLLSFATLLLLLLVLRVARGDSLLLCIPVLVVCG